MTTVGKVKKVLKELLKVTGIDSDEKYLAIHTYLFHGGKKPSIPAPALAIVEYLREVIKVNKFKNMDEVIDFYNTKRNTMLAFAKNLLKTFENKKK
jgi:hypothetical protein